MERTLKNTIVKKGLIIAYYFSNRWFGKCLCQDCQRPDHPDADSVKIEKSIQDNDSCSKKNTNPSPPVSKQQINEKVNWDETVKNTNSASKKD